MRRPLLLGLALLLTLGACGTRLNPFNWFRGSEPVQVAQVKQDDHAKPGEKRPLVAQLISLKVEPAKGGAIVQAVGLPPTQGFWDAELVARPVENGHITYDFRASPPVGAAAVSTQQSREISVAAFITAFKLEEIREITVVAAGNALSSRR